MMFLGLAVTHRVDRRVQALVVPRRSLEDLPRPGSACCRQRALRRHATGTAAGRMMYRNPCPPRGASAAHLDDVHLRLARLTGEHGVQRGYVRPRSGLAHVRQDATHRDLVRACRPRSANPSRARLPPRSCRPHWRHSIYRLSDASSLLRSLRPRTIHQVSASPPPSGLDVFAEGHGAAHRRVLAVVHVEPRFLRLAGVPAARQLRTAVSGFSSPISAIAAIVLGHLSLADRRMMTCSPSAVPSPPGRSPGGRTDRKVSTDIHRSGSRPSPTPILRVLRENTNVAVM